MTLTTLTTTTNDGPHLDEDAAVALHDRQADGLHLLDQHEEVADALLARDAREARHVRHDEAAVDRILPLDQPGQLGLLLGHVGVLVREQQIVQLAELAALVEPADHRRE